MTTLSELSLMQFHSQSGQYSFSLFSIKAPTEHAQLELNRQYIIVYAKVREGSQLILVQCSSVRIQTHQILRCIKKKSKGLPKQFPYCLNTVLLSQRKFQHNGKNK